MPGFLPLSVGTISALIVTSKVAFFAAGAALSFILRRSTAISTSNLLISAADRERLQQLLDSSAAAERTSIAQLDALESKLSRAAVVEADELPLDIVTLGSTLWFRDLESDEVGQYTLVEPWQADVVRDRVSVLSPIGTALLGCRLGDVVEARLRFGTRSMEIVKVNQEPLAMTLPLAPVGV